MAGKNVSFWVFIAILVVAHFILHVALGLGTSAPDFLTIALLFGSRRLSGAGAAGLGLGLGVLNDALSLTRFGAQALVYSIIGFLGARSRDLFEGDSLLFVALYMFLGKWLRDILYFIITGSQQTDSWARLVTSAPLAGIYAAVAGIVALLLYRAATGER